MLRSRRAARRGPSRRRCRSRWWGSARRRPRARAARRRGSGPHPSPPSARRRTPRGAGGPAASGTAHGRRGCPAAERRWSAAVRRTRGSPPQWWRPAHVPQADALAERVVAAVAQHRHVEQGRGAVLKRPREAIRDDRDVVVTGPSQPEPAVASGADRAGLTQAARPLHLPRLRAVAGHHLGLDDAGPQHRHRRVTQPRTWHRSREPPAPTHPGHDPIQEPLTRVIPIRYNGSSALG